MQIEPTVTLGNILSIVVSIGSIAVAFWRVASRLTKMGFKVNMIWRWYKKEHGIEDGDADE